MRWRVKDGKSTPFINASCLTQAASVTMVLPHLCHAATLEHSPSYTFDNKLRERLPKKITNPLVNQSDEGL